MFAVYITNAAPVADSASPIYSVTVPSGYRDWKVISIARLKTDKVDQWAPLVLAGILRAAEGAVDDVLRANP